MCTRKYLQGSLVALITTSLLVTITTSLPQGSNLPFPSPIQSMPCSRNQDCSSKFPDSKCGSRGVCECEKYFIEEGPKCLPVILDFTSDCSLNAQCAMGLGEFSRCSDSTKKCECYDTKGNGKNATGHYGNTCYIRRGLGDPCDIREECRASIGPPEHVRCDVKTRTCVCNDGETCENLPGTGLVIEKSLTLMLITFMAIKVIA